MPIPSPTAHHFPQHDPFLGWYRGGHLPHYDRMHLVQSLTFRLADSLPAAERRNIERELAHFPVSEREHTRRMRIERFLDNGYGCCALRHPRVAKVMEEALLRFDGGRYRMLAWCIMPNHVHALIDQLSPLWKVLLSWKSFTAKRAIVWNEELNLGIPNICTGKENHFWMRDYWDRFIRDENHMRNAVRYIHENPVRAGLCARPEDWPWSSARFLYL